MLKQFLNTLQLLDRLSAPNF